MAIQAAKLAPNVNKPTGQVWSQTC